jgi:integrase
MSVRKRKWTTAKGVEKDAWIVDYVDGDGTRRLKTFARKKEADAFEATSTVEVREGTHVPDSATVTIDEAARKWMDSGAQAGLERTTLDQYRQHVELHIKPFIGRMLLSKLTVPAMRAFQDKLREEGRSPGMVKRVTISFGSLLSDAQERGLVARNAVKEMAKRRSRGSQGRAEKRQKARLQVGVDIPTRDEIRAIVEHVEGRWRPFIITAIFTGLRASELRGLRWTDIELDAGKLHVRQRADRYHTIGMPKSDAGQRTVPLPPIVVNTLREWKLACPKGEEGLAFPNGAGNVEWHPNLIKRGLWPPQIAAGMTVTDADGTVRPKYTGMHALRHFYASWCINRRIDGGLELPAKMVQSRMGHSSIMMTMDVYGHLFPSMDDSEALAAAEWELLGVVNAT